MSRVVVIGSGGTGLSVSTEDLAHHVEQLQEMLEQEAQAKEKCITELFELTNSYHYETDQIHEPKFHPWFNPNSKAPRQIC